jgi:DNA polymerase-3 subunit alpha
VFVDDARRNGIVLLGPDINRSEAEFCVEQTDEGLGVRYALAGIRNVGEKAMDQIVAEREANGPFESLEDLFRRSPAGSMNRRQLEGLAGAGALDCLDPNRAKVMANADMLLAVADAATRERSSGQAGLFGGDDHAEPSLRLVETEAWSRAQQMEAERENFGFYFAAHPVTEYRMIASSHGARTFGSLTQGDIGGERSQAVMAALVESVSKGRTKRGADFVRATFSDATGQFTAACFEESLVDSFQRWAAEGACVLLTVELDKPNPDDAPRVTVRGARPLAEVTGAARMVLECDIEGEGALAALAESLAPGKPGHGEVLVRLRIGEAVEPLVRLGRDFDLHGELVDRLAIIPGVANVALRPRRGASSLRLVA